MSGSVCEAMNIWPSSELALSKLVHFSQGQLASMFIVFFLGTNVFVCVCICSLVVFHMTLKTDIVRKQADEDFASSQV